MRYRFLRFPEGKFKAVTFSYDDGCRADIKLSEMLCKYGLWGTFNLNSSCLGKDTNDWHLTATHSYSALTAHEFTTPRLRKFGSRLTVSYTLLNPVKHLN